MLALYFLLRGTRARNGLLLAASLFFYAWGETGYLLVLLLSIAINYLFGHWIDRSRGGARGRRVLGVAVGANLLLLLAAFKYANFTVDNLNLLLIGVEVPPVELAPVHLPIGISFFTFQALTYLVEVYRRDAPAQRNPLRVALYIALFPQLIAGPIVRYREIASQLAQRTSRIDEIAEGARRFVLGLGKKVLVANTLALPADRIFAIPAAELATPVAWLGLTCFTLQIYFDFSGYSDMAIGLGRIFGFRFPENFDHPYTSRSLREFWRRWHISLSTWFRDYLYIPLDGSRRSPARTSLNLALVFLLCGLWHGASWNFVIWGALHGAFLALERGRFGAWLARGPRGLQHLYTLAVVALAWVFFRADTLPEALSYLGSLLGSGAGAAEAVAHPLALYLDATVAFALAVAVLGSAPWYRGCLRALARRGADPERSGAAWTRAAFGLAQVVCLNALLLLCAMALAAGTHNPFIYFRF